MSAETEEYSQLSLSQRLIHKNWKARIEAYEELSLKFQTLDSLEFTKYSENLKNIISDSHQSAQETGLLTLVAFLTHAPTNTALKYTRNTLVPLVVEKCFGAARQGTRTNALEALITFIEIENSDYVINSIIQSLNHKTPKNVMTAIHALKEITRLFGTDVVNLKPILKSLLPIFDHKDKNIRLLGSELTVEMYRWMGPAINSFLSTLKPIQIKELNDSFEKCSSEKPIPQRFLRSNSGIVNQEKPPGMGKSHTEETLVVIEEPEDPLRFIDPVNILDKLPKNFYDELWKDRKEALEKLLELLKSPKLEDGRYGELINCLGKKINDANVIVVTLAANSLEKIALGLGHLFFQYKSMVLSSIIERLKEKKTNVVDALKAALDALYKSCNGVADVLEDTCSALSHKNPQIRYEVLQWLIRSLKISKKALSKPDLKTLCQLLVKTCDDGTDTVRDSAAEALGTLMKTTSEKAVSLHLDKLDKVKQAKVREYFSSCSSDKPQDSQPELKQNTIANVSKKGTIAPMKKPTGKVLVAKKPSRAQNSSLPEKIIQEKPAKSNFEEPIKYIFSDSSAEEYVNDLLPGIHESLGDSNWKTRLEGIQKILALVKNDYSLKSEAFVNYLVKRPGWKDNNFQILINLANIFENLAKECIDFDRASASLAIPGLVEKIGDIKVKKVAASCLLSISEKVSMQFVLCQLYPCILNLKNPKALNDAILWINEALIDFGSDGVDTPKLVNFLKSFIGNSNQSVRSAAIQTIATFQSFVTKDLRSMLSELTPQQMQLIDAEISKPENQTARNPVKIQNVKIVESNKPVIQKASQPTSKTARTQSPSPPVAISDDVESRNDISMLISDDIIANIGNSNWKVRKEGLDEVAKILESSHYSIKPNLNHDLYAALKLRLSDSNKNLVMQTADICGNLAKSMGKHFDKASRILLGPLLSILGDLKPQTRAHAIQALDKIFDALNLNTILPTLSTSLMQELPQLRKDLLKWIVDCLEKNASANVDFSVLIHPIFICLQDKNVDVRKLSQSILPFMCATLGIQALIDKSSDLFKGSALATLMNFLEPLKSITVKVPDTVPKNMDVEIPSKKITKLAKVRSSNIDNPIPVQKKEVVQDLACDVEFCLLAPDMKAKELRAVGDKGTHKWSFESPRKDLLDLLSEQCQLVLNSDTHILLFSDDHYKEKNFLMGLNSLDDSLRNRADKVSGLTVDEINQRFISCSDLLLKYITIRFFDSNTSILIKVLEFLENLFEMMQEVGYLLSDYEASSFLPFFINKTGDSKETLRIKIRLIMKHISKLYPASKLFNYVMKGIDSKNSRTRVECLDELAYLVQRNGMNVCSPNKVFPLIAAQVSDRDPSVRNAALGVIVQGYLLVGDAVFKSLGRINDKDRSLIDERIKRLPPADIKPHFPVAEPIIAKSKIVKDITVAKSVVHHESPKLVRREFSLDLEALETNIPLVSASASHENLKEKVLISEVTAIDPIGSIAALKKLEENLTKDASTFINSTNDLVSNLTTHTKACFTSAELFTVNGSRLGKYLLKVLNLIFTNLELVKTIQRETLSECIEEVLFRLLDPTLTNLEQGPALSKMLNILMVRLLQNSNSNLIFSILLELLGTSSQKMVHYQDKELATQSKYTDLVMKCVWKLIKTIPQLLQENSIDIPALLLDVHVFLTKYPPAEWKRRISLKIPQADMPLRTVKTILSMLLTSLGPAVIEKMTLVSDSENSHATIYLKQMIDADSKKGKSFTKNANSASLSPQKATKLSPDQINQQLDSIFHKISDKDLTKIGIKELFDYQKRYPYASIFIEEHLSKKNNFIRGYIKRAVSALEEGAADNQESQAELEIAEFKEPVEVENRYPKEEKTIDQNLRPSMALCELKERLARMKQAKTATNE